MISRVRLIVVGVLLLIGAGVLVIRTMNAQGFFTAVPPNTPLVCRTIPSADGPEEIAFDPQSRLVFISARDRRKPRDNPNPNDGLYVFSIDRANDMPRKLSGVPENFHPHGMSLYRDREGNLTLMVINHRAKKSSVVEIFDAAAAPDKVQLFHRATIEGSLLLSPNDVVAVGRDRFYVTNDKGSTSAFGIWLERNLLLGRSKLVYFDGGKLVVASQGLQSANGIGVSPDGTKIYVAELSARQLRIYNRDQFSGALTEPEDEAQRSYGLPLGIDNIDVAPDGSIAVAGHTKIPESRAFLTQPDKPSPSAVYLVNTKNGYPVSSGILFADDGRRLGASSTGVRIGDRLIVSSPYEKKILDCRL